MSNEEDYGLTEEETHDYDRAISIIQEFTDFNDAFELILWALEQSAKVPNDGKFSNATAAMAAFTRAFHEVQACISLCQVHLYPQALALLRSVYEAAGIGRTMAKSMKIADEWLQGKWQPDAKSRQFVRNVMYSESTSEEKDDAVAPYTQSYETLSQWAHITATSALAPYVEDSEDGYNLKLRPEFDEEQLRFTLNMALKETVFLAYAIRNSAARLEVFGSAWLERLDALGERVAGDYIEKLEIDYQELDLRRDNIVSNLRNSSEHKRHMRRDAQSVDNLMKNNGE